MSQDSTTPIVNQGTGGSSAWKVDGSASTQPVSGTVTVQQSTASNLKVDLSGTGANSTALLVTGTGGTFPISGTVAATQSGTWTVQPGNTANSTAWLVTGTGGTFPVTSATLQLDATGAALNLAQASTTSGQTGPLVQTATTTSAPSYTNAKTNPLSTTTAGALRVDGSAVTQPVSGTVTATTSYVSITATGGSFSSSGNNTLITPSNSLRISYLSLNAAAANSAAVLCLVKFTTGGSTIYEVQLLPGAIWAHHPAAGNHYVTGTAGQALVVNIDSAQTVYWSLEYADV